jgi:hypothetical protein
VDFFMSHASGTTNFFSKRSFLKSSSRMRASVSKNKIRQKIEVFFARHEPATLPLALARVEHFVPTGGPVFNSETVPIALTHLGTKGLRFA